jgi:hypothetical protein
VSRHLSTSWLPEFLFAESELLARFEFEEIYHEVAFVLMDGGGKQQERTRPFHGV